MHTAPTHTLTRLLQAWSVGNADAAEDLLPLVYEHLRGMARGYMHRERGDHTLQPTALVHEAYLRLANGGAIPWHDRLHFYNVAARAMRRILVDHARARAAVRRRGDYERKVPLTERAEELAVGYEGNGTDLIALDAALEQLARVDTRRSRVVEMRFFGRMDAADIAAVLDVSEKTVLRDWQVAKIWLHAALEKLIR